MHRELLKNGVYTSVESALLCINIISLILLFHGKNFFNIELLKKLQMKKKVPIKRL